MNVLIVFLGLLPSFIWLSFFLQEDIHPEPRKMIFLVFLMGIIAAVFAVALQYPLEGFLKSRGMDMMTFLPITILATIEELFKFGFAYLAISKSKFLDEPVDAMIYMVGVASGMAAFENVALMLSPEVISQKSNILVLRFLGATLLHVLSSSIVGYYWAKGMMKKNIAVWVLAGLIMAGIFHGIFNYLIVLSNGGIIYSILFLIISAFFIFYDFEKLKGSAQKLEH